jgi:hypothetical protein
MHMRADAGAGAAGAAAAAAAECAGAAGFAGAESSLGGRRARTRREGKATR